MSNLKQRVVAGIGANVMAQAITIAIQLASLPLFLRHWDISRYGLWLMISAVPSYFSMADVGMVTAAGNKMTMAIGRGDTIAANRVFQSALAFMLITCGALALVSVPVILGFSLPGLHPFDQRLALAALVLSVLLTLFGGLPEAIFKATGRYALGTNLSNLVRVGEWCGWIAGLILFGSFAAVAIGGLAIRLAGLFIIITRSAQGQHGLEWRLTDAKWREVRAMFKPAFSFMAFPLSNSLSFQGMTLLTGSVFGPSAVAIFNTYRTLARVAVQVTSIFSYALWPEFSLHFGRGGADAVISMYRRAAVMGVGVAMSLSAALYLLGPLLLKFWTHGSIAFRSSLMLLMLAYAAVSSAWHVPRVLLLSTNEHNSLAAWSLLIAVASLGVAAALAREWQLEGIVASMLLSELAIAVVCAHIAQRLLLTRSFRVANDAV